MMDKQKKMFFRNGRSMVSGGYRQALFSDTLALRPVSHMSYKSENVVDHATFQVEPQNGDIITKASWKDGREYGFLGVFNGEKFVPVTGHNERAQLWMKLYQAHPWLKGFLTIPAEDSNSYLPSPACSVVSYLCNRVKAARVKDAIYKYGLPVTFDAQWALTDKNNLNTRPRDLDLRMDNPVEREGANETWYGSFGDHSPAVVLPCTNHGIQNWKKYPFLVRVTREVFPTMDVYVTSWKFVRTVERNRKTKKAA